MDSFDKAAKNAEEVEKQRLVADDLAQLRGRPEYEKTWQESLKAAESENWDYFKGWNPNTNYQSSLSWSPKANAGQAGDMTRRWYAQWSDPTSFSLLNDTDEKKAKDAAFLAKGEALEEYYRRKSKAPKEAIVEYESPQHSRK